MPRIALIHALAHSPPPINAALAQAWPEAVRMNLLDDSLSADLARAGRLDEAMTARFLALADYAVATGSDAILFTCSAFGPCIDAVKRRHATLPVLKPNEAMIDEAVALAGEGAGPAGRAGTAGHIGRTGHIGRIGLIASFEPTLQSMPAEFPAGVDLRCRLADGAMAALDRGDVAGHDAAVARAARTLADEGCVVLALAQFSMARALPAVAAALSGLPVLTTPASAVRRLRQALGADAPG
jgi:hypothetical protein